MTRKETFKQKNSDAKNIILLDYQTNLSEPITVTNEIFNI